MIGGSATARWDEFGSRVVFKVMPAGWTQWISISRYEYLREWDGRISGRWPETDVDRGWTTTNIVQRQRVNPFSVFYDYDAPLNRQVTYTVFFHQPQTARGARQWFNTEGIGDTFHPPLDINVLTTSSRPKWFA